MPVMNITAGDSSFNLSFGVEEHVRAADLSLYAGGNDYKEATSVYEADKGNILIEAIPNIVSQWGQAS